jgi:hypothetical protein
MASAVHKERLVVSSPTFHPDERRWIPSVTISWRVGRENHFHDIKGFPTRFDHKEEAEIFGMEAAKAWIDKRLMLELAPGVVPSANQSPLDPIAAVKGSRRQPAPGAQVHPSE